MQGYSGFKKKKNTIGSTLAIVALLHVVAAGGLIWLASTATGREMLAVYKINILNLPLPEPKAAPEASAGKTEEAVASPVSEETSAEVTPQTPEAPPPDEPEAEVPSPEPVVAPPPTELVSTESSGEDVPSGNEVPSEDSSIDMASIQPLQESPGVEEGGGGEGTGSGLGEIAGLPSSPSPIRLPGSANPFGAGRGGRGGGKGRKFSGYADIVTSEIQKYYKQPSDLPGNVRLAVLLQLLLDEDGRLIEYKLMRSSGNTRFDESAIQALTQIKQLRRPPQGMSNTLTVKFFPPTG